jgi:methylmalonyl-CoA mutase C-terminal domain/subunit
MERVKGMENKLLRVLVAKLGLDGHDRGAKIIARMFRDNGMEVIYTGIRQTPSMVTRATLEEDVDLIGISILSGAHMDLIPLLFQELEDKGLSDIPVIIGGIIPDQDRRKLLDMGVVEVFGPGTSSKEIIKFVKNIFGGDKN